MFKDLRQKMGKDVTVKKPKPKKQGTRSQRSSLTPEQYAERNQRNRMKDRAAILSIKEIGGGMYQVWGGEAPHLVTDTMGWITCDCRGWSSARNHNCSHVMKFRLTFGDLKK